MIKSSTPRLSLTKSLLCWMFMWMDLALAYIPKNPRTALSGNTNTLHRLPHGYHFTTSPKLSSLLFASAEDSANESAGSTLTLKECSAKIESEIAFLTKAAETKAEDPDRVVDSLMSLEKLMRQKNRLDEGSTSKQTLENLSGAWRLIFTTGTVDAQKRTGRRINYFPLKAVQSFDTTTFDITNAIYLGDFPVLKFFGEFSWKEKARKLEFDFDAIAVLGLRFNLPKGGAAKIGSQTGLGSESNKALIEKQKRKPFFNWISADGNIATARGGGGGLALWKKDTETLK